MTIHWRDLTKQGRIEAIKAVYEPGMSANEIATAIGGITRDAVIGMYSRYRDDLSQFKLRPFRVCCRAKKKKRERKERETIWTQEKLDLVAELLREGKSSREIGERVGVSKNSVISLVKRSNDLSEIGFKYGIGRPKGLSPRPQFVAVGLPISTVGRSIAHLGGHQCRWPVNDAEEGELHLFCGAATDRSYCREHAAIAYRPREAV